MGHSLRTWVLGIGLSLGACFPSLDGLTGGTTDAGSSPDAARPDATTTESDATIPGTDASADATPDAGPFCTVHAAADTFCSDFDLNDLTFFTGVTANGGGTVTLDNDAGLSPPGSLVTNIPSRPVADAGAFSQAYVHHKSAPAQSSVGEISFAMRIEKASADRLTSLAVLQFVGPDRNYEARISLDSDRTLFISEFDTKTQAYGEPFRTSKALPAGVWLRIRYRVELLAANSGRADLEIDGAPAVTALALTPAITSGSLRTSLGLPFCRAPNDAWTIRYDDLLIFPK